MKKILNPVVRSIVSTQAGWFLGSTIIKVGEWFRYEKSLLSHKNSERVLNEVFDNKVVKAGFFKGLIYPALTSYGSSIFPKLAGSYESELFPVLNKIALNTYDTIVDIGCAEGYYAVGLAKHFTEAKVYAFDISLEAQRLCKQMAVINEVDDNVIICGECTSEWLGVTDFSKKHLIVSDCEGFEEKLFTPQNIGNLSNCDLIIEMHPMHVAGIANYLTQLFENSHNLQLVSSYDDARKLFDLDKEYCALTDLEKLKIIQEGRSFTMDWLIAFSKK